MGFLHHHRSQIPVSFFADFLLWFAFAGVPTPRSQPQKATDGTTLWESMRVFNRQDIGQRDLRSYKPFTCWSKNTSGYTSLAIFSIRSSYSWMRSLSDATSLKSGDRTSRNSAFTP